MFARTTPRAASDMASPRVTEEHWMLLTAAQLSEWCEDYELPRAGNKSQLTQRLMREHILYDNCDSVSLENMCGALGLPISGTDDDLIGHLTGTTSQGKTKRRRPNAEAFALVSEEHFHCLTGAMLFTLCERKGLLKSGNKDQQVERVMEEAITYAELRKKFLKKICDKSGLDSSGEVGKMIAQITQRKGGNKKKKVVPPAYDSTDSDSEEDSFEEDSSEEDSTDEDEAPVNVKPKPPASTPKPAKPTSTKPATHSAKARKLKMAALVVGVSAYQQPALRLKNAAKDARDLAAALRSRGVDVTLLQDPNISQLRKGVQHFCHNKITEQTDLAIFFYAGHGGLCVGSSGSLAGKHIMMASCWQDSDPNHGGFASAAEIHGYSIEAVMSTMQQRGTLNLVLVDACRSPARGMRSASDEAASSRAWRSHQLENGPRTLLCNACKSLHTASDGVAGKNGLYTEALLKHLFDKKHPSLHYAIGWANEETSENSNGQQEPSMEAMNHARFQAISLA